MFKDKILLVTGGTGSFGNAVIKKLLKTSIKEIRIFSRDEKKQEEMRLRLNDRKLKFYIGDVRDYDSINQAMKGVHYVFHAAALKHVVLLETRGFRLGLRVDRALEDLEVFVREVPAALSCVRPLGGVAILPDGVPVFLLEVGALVEEAV